MASEKSISVSYAAINNFVNFVQGDSTTDGQSDGQSDRLLDTVGAVCVDGEGRICSTASSGGIVLKQPGRLGQVR